MKKQTNPKHVQIYEDLDPNLMSPEGLISRFSKANELVPQPQGSWAQFRAASDGSLSSWELAMLASQPRFAQSENPTQAALDFHFVAYMQINADERKHAGLSHIVEEYERAQAAERTKTLAAWGREKLGAEWPRHKNRQIAFLTRYFKAMGFTQDPRDTLSTLCKESKATRFLDGLQRSRSSNKKNEKES